MRRFLILAVFASAVALIGMGLLRWPVTGPVNLICHRLEAPFRWHVTVEKASWIPWKGLTLQDLKLETADGGRLHLVRIQICPLVGSLWRGGLLARCSIEGVRIDPASWGLRQPLLQEILSAGPVATEGYALLEFRADRLTIDTFTLQGPMLRLHAEGWLLKKLQGRLDLEGALARRLLEELRLMKPLDQMAEANLWEPFQLHLSGALANPMISFASNFFSITGENRS